MDYELICQFVQEISRRKDPWNHHGQSVRGLVNGMADFIDHSFTNDEKAMQGWAASLHDLGKILLSDELLNHTRVLTETETQQMRTHVRLGFSLAFSMRMDPYILMAIFQHHENYDGSGYPAGASAHRICIQARMIRVADTYDAITSPRSYRPPRSKEDALKILREGTGTQFDPDVVQALERFLEQEAEHDAHKTD